VATAPTAARTQGVTAPIAKYLDCTAQPTSPAAGSAATIENVPAISSMNAGYAPGVPYYILNFVPGQAAQRERVAELLQVGMWGIDADEPHRDALAAGDLVLVYLGAPDRAFVGSAALASAVHAWTTSEARACPGDSSSGVLLAQVEEWDPPVPMEIVLSRLDPTAKARADFEAGVVRITAHEHETVLAVAAERVPSTG
jgi:hypothetical protein